MANELASSTALYRIQTHGAGSQWSRIHVGLPLFIAVDKDNSEIVVSLLNAGADVNATNAQGKNAVCFAVESLISRSYYSFVEVMRNRRLSTIRLLIKYGATFNMQLPYGNSPLYLPVAVSSSRHVRRVVVELMQLMVEHGAMLQDSNSLPAYVDYVCRRSLDFGPLIALTTFDGSHEFIPVVQLFRAGAGLQLIALYCIEVASFDRERSIRLCQAAVLAGYVPSDEELQQLQLAAARNYAVDHLIHQRLLNWLNEDRQQVPSLHRQCRVVIRRQLAVAARFKSMLPAIEQLDLPDVIKEYLQFDGPLSEVDLRPTRP